MTITILFPLNKISDAEDFLEFLEKKYQDPADGLYSYSSAYVAGNQFEVSYSHIDEEMVNLLADFEGQRKNDWWEYA